MLYFKAPAVKLFVALRNPGDITSVVKHFGTPLVFSYDEQKVYMQDGKEIRRYAYHIEDGKKHGVEEILGCELRDACGIAKLVREELYAEGAVVGSCRKAYDIEQGVNHFFFDVIYMGVSYEFGIHLARTDSLYYQHIGWAINITYVKKDINSHVRVNSFDKIIDKYIG